MEGAKTEAAIANKNVEKNTVYTVKLPKQSRVKKKTPPISKQIRGNMNLWWQSASPDVLNETTVLRIDQKGNRRECLRSVL